MESSELETAANEEALAKEAEEIRNALIKDTERWFKKSIETEVGGTIETILENGERKETIVDESGDRIYGTHNKVKRSIYIPPNNVIGIIAEDDGKDGIYLRGGKLFEDYGGLHDEVGIFEELPNGEHVLEAKDKGKEWLYRKDGSPVKEYGIPHHIIFEFFELPDEGWVLRAEDIIDGEPLEGLYRKDGSLIEEYGLHRIIHQILEIPDTGEIALEVPRGKCKVWLRTKNGLVKDFGGEPHEEVYKFVKGPKGETLLVVRDCVNGKMKARWLRKDGTIARERFSIWMDD